MAEHFWLARRARMLQDNALAENAERTFALYLRYQTTNDRAFLKCLNELTKLAAARRKQDLGFESQKREQESHEARVRLAHARAATLELETECKRMMSAPLPGFTEIPFDRVKEIVEHGFQHAAREMQAAAS